MSSPRDDEVSVSTVNISWLYLNSPTQYGILSISQLRGEDFYPAPQKTRLLFLD